MSSQNDHFETKLITLPNTRIKRETVHLNSTSNATTMTNSTNPQHINSSIQEIVDKNSELKTTKGTY